MNCDRDLESNFRICYCGQSVQIAIIVTDDRCLEPWLTKVRRFRESITGDRKVYLFRLRIFVFENVGKFKSFDFSEQISAFVVIPTGKLNECETPAVFRFSPRVKKNKKKSPLTSHPLNKIIESLCARMPGDQEKAELTFFLDLYFFISVRMSVGKPKCFR